MTIITDLEFACIMGEAYSETIDLPLLEDVKNKQLFKQFDNAIKYVLYNYFNISVVKSDLNDS